MFELITLPNTYYQTTDKIYGLNDQLFAVAGNPGLTAAGLPGLANLSTLAGAQQQPPPPQPSHTAGLISYQQIAHLHSSQLNGALANAQSQQQQQQHHHMQQMNAASLNSNALLAAALANSAQQQQHQLQQHGNSQSTSPSSTSSLLSSNGGVSVGQLNGVNVMAHQHAQFGLSSSANSSSSASTSPNNNNLSNNNNNNNNNNTNNSVLNGSTGAIQTQAPYGINGAPGGGGLLATNANINNCMSSSSSSSNHSSTNNSSTTTTPTPTHEQTNGTKSENVRKINQISDDEVMKKSAIFLINSKLCKRGF
jgi:hypothetical protein